ncbi:MAG: V-type ATP synthase subunit I [Treponema sp.]|jgi:V/A-type H+-transporting ATPase subunit I|nr:V-type ATP synthase subunit I [Treponema sp.]
MIRPRAMKRVQLTALKSDVDAVIEYLGRRELMHFDEAGNGAESADAARIKGLLEKLHDSCDFLGVEFPSEPDEDSVLPGEADVILAGKLCAAVDELVEKEGETRREKQHIEEALGEAKAFANLNAPFADLDQLSYLTLRLGRLDPRFQPELKKRLAERVVLIPLGGEESGRVLAASSRKGRFALDSELKNCAFESIAIPEGYQGVPDELLQGLEGRLDSVTRDLERVYAEKTRMRDEKRTELQRLGCLLLMALAAEQLKSRLVSTSSIYMLSGWVPSDTVKKAAADLLNITGGRTAIRVYAPDEIPEVRSGGEKVPVSLKHGAFIKGFEGVVSSYGTPLYGTIDPTPLVAIFFTVLFGIMFGDLGQGFVLLLAGLLAGKYGPRPLARFRHFSSPLIAVGIASMFMGLLTGEVFTSDRLLASPTRALSAALAGHPMDRILVIMPLAEQGGSVKKLFYFFGFTIGIGIIINSLGLLVNIVNRCMMKKYEAAFFTKTGLAGLLLFWYAVFIALRCIFGGHFEKYDFAGIFIPAACIFFGPLIWRRITREKPLLEHGLMTFIMEGFVEVMETASTYISNTVSFLRVGAFALSHAVLSYIVFRFTEELARTGNPLGSASALLILIFGNLVIIVLEGMIVAIQVVRLQYYEFFSKFFTETGVEFSPFRFRKSEVK